MVVSSSQTSRSVVIANSKLDSVIIGSVRATRPRIALVAAWALLGEDLDMWSWITLGIYCIAICLNVMNAKLKKKNATVIELLLGIEVTMQNLINKLRLEVTSLLESKPSEK